MVCPRLELDVCIMMQAARQEQASDVPHQPEEHDLQHCQQDRQPLPMMLAPIQAADHATSFAASTEHVADGPGDPPGC